MAGLDSARAKARVSGERVASRARERVFDMGVLVAGRAALGWPLQDAF